MKGIGLFLLITATVVEGLFPTVCVENITHSGICCPAPDGFTEPCGGSGRGSCRAFPTDVNGDSDDRRPLWVELSNDDRLHWPTRFIKEGCHCEGNFHGYDCSLCTFGYKGENCKEKSPIYIRPNIVTLMKDDARRTKFIRTLDQSKYEPSGWSVMNLTKEVDALARTKTLTFHPVSVYNLFVFRHVYASRSSRLADGTFQKWATSALGHNIDWAHFGPVFLPWHRLWGLWLERELQRISDDPTLALPYWDWADNEGSKCPFCTEDFLGATDTGDKKHGLLNSPFAKWATMCAVTEPNGGDVCDPTVEEGRISRNPGGDCEFPRTPAQSEIDYTLALPFYDTPPFNGRGSQSFSAVVDGTWEYVPPFPKMTMHAQVHLWFNGTMSEAFTTAANDPVFILHHNFVDKLWERWNRLHEPAPEDYPGKEAPIGHAANDWLVPFYPPERTITYVTRTRDLGYSYEGLEDDV